MDDGRRRRRRRTTEAPIDETFGPDREKQMPLHIAEEERAMMRSKAHGCPVPKPAGIIGRVLGFKDQTNGEEQSRPQIVTQKASKGRKDDS